MNRTSFRAVVFVTILTALVLSINLVVGAQDKPQHDHSAMAKQEMAKAQAGTATMTAKLVDPEAKAQKKEATVTVDVKGIQLTDPATANEQPKAGQGHIHYQVDDGPVIATTSPKLSFHGLSSGAHKITITLAANDHSPLAPPQTLTVTIP
ncbi:MAG TPA: hypothetical protein VF131_28255 [Blastocatellia bacterium]|nr:hypothetical protein [Blastocatellia bacterium]